MFNGVEGRLWRCIHMLSKEISLWLKTHYTFKQDIICWLIQLHEYNGIYIYTYAWTNKRWKGYKVFIVYKCCDEDFEIIFQDDGVKTWTQ